MTDACSKCGLNYEWRPTPGRDRAPGTCKVCRRALPHRVRRRLPEARAEIAAAFLRRRWAKKIAKAGRAVPPRCEACGTVFVDPLSIGHQKPGSHHPCTPCFDHNHTTGAFRGWLCQPCNRALGLAKDSPRTLSALANYVRIRGHGAKT